MNPKAALLCHGNPVGAQMEDQTEQERFSHEQGVDPDSVSSDTENPESIFKHLTELVKRE